MQTDAQWQQRNESTENEVGVTFVLCITRVIHARARPSYTQTRASEGTDARETRLLCGVSVSTTGTNMWSMFSFIKLTLTIFIYVFYRLKWKKGTKPMIRHPSTVMSQIDEIMLEEQSDKALDCVSVRSSRFSIPSLHLSSLSINRIRKDDCRP